MPLARIAWLLTIGACLVTSLLLLMSHFDGYAGVFVAIALAASINLF
jgi:hypothetical protein